MSVEEIGIVSLNFLNNVSFRSPVYPPPPCLLTSSQHEPKEMGKILQRSGCSCRHPGTRLIGGETGCEPFLLGLRPQPSAIQL